MSKHRIISSGKLRHILFCLGLALLIVSVGVTTTFSQAPKRYKPEVRLPPEYPNGFNGYGEIEVMKENGVVIDDQFFKLASFVTYHTPTNMYATSADFQLEDLVGYLTNLEDEITSLWLIQ
jgi:hypothetical protein